MRATDKTKKYTAHIGVRPKSGDVIWSEPDQEEGGGGAFVVGPKLSGRFRGFTLLQIIDYVNGACGAAISDFVRIYTPTLVDGWEGGRLRRVACVEPKVPDDFYHVLHPSGRVVNGRDADCEREGRIRFSEVFMFFGNFNSALCLARSSRPLGQIRRSLIRGYPRDLFMQGLEYLPSEVKSSALSRWLSLGVITEDSDGILHMNPD